MTFQRKDDLEARLRRARRQPRADLVEAIFESVHSQRAPARSHAWRVVFAGGLSAALLVALASVGGLSYAASSTWHAVKAAANVAHSKPTPQLSAAASQYGHKTTICHKGHTITVDDHALPAHMRHHDTIGPCPTGG